LMTKTILHTYNGKRILNTILNEIQEVVIAQYFF